MDSERKPRRKTENWSEDEEDVIILQETGECIYRLNRTASFIWKLADGTQSVGDIAEKIREQFAETPSEDELLKIVNAILDELDNLDVIEWA